MFFDDTIIVEIYLKNGKVFKNVILKNYPSYEQNQNNYNITFNLVKFITSPFPSFALYMRQYIESGEVPEIEEKCVGIVIAGEVLFLRLMDSTILSEKDKTLLFME